MSGKYLDEHPVGTSTTESSSISLESSDAVHSPVEVMEDVTMRLNSHHLQYIRRFLLGVITQKLSSINPVCQLSTSVEHSTLTVSVSKNHPQCHALLDKCADVVTGMIHTFEKPVKILSMPGRVSEEQLTRDMGLRALEGATGVMSCYVREGPLKLLHTKTSPRGAVALVESYLQSLLDVCEQWPKQPTLADQQRLQFVISNEVFFRSEMNASGVTLAVVQDDRRASRCELRGPLCKVNYALRQVERVLYMDIAVPPSSLAEECVQAVMHLLDSLEQLHAPRGPREGIVRDKKVRRICLRMYSLSSRGGVWRRSGRGAAAGLQDCSSAIGCTLNSYSSPFPSY